MAGSRFWQYFTDCVYCFTLYPYILNHKYRTHKYGENIDEKFGKVNKRIRDRDCLLIHAVSVGEVIAAQPIIKEFKKRYRNWDIHISVSTATGREVAVKRYPDIPVSFFPLDISLWVNRFFDKISPSAVILMELEIWPNFLETCNNRNIPVIIANGRITEKSSILYNKYKWLPILKRMLKVPALWLSQNADYTARFRKIGIAADRIKTIGSVKYDTIPTNPDSKIRDKYRRLFQTSQNTKILIAGSTHNPEEEILLKSFIELRNKETDLQLVLVPRHPHRFEEVFTLAQTAGKAVKFSQLSTGTAADNTAADIIVIDQMGILTELYNAADLVFIGGSFIDHGGQSMLEPCGLGKTTIMGSSYYNFTEPVNLLQKEECIIILDSADQLTYRLQLLLEDYAATERIGEKARITLLKHQGASEMTIDCLTELIQ